MATELNVTSPWANKAADIANGNSVHQVLNTIAVSTAISDLQEDEQTKTEALQEFREWIRRNNGLVNVRTDDTFLLRFLRARKWNVASAEHHLVKYLNFRQSIAQYTMHLDPDEEKVCELIHSGYLFPSPIRDSMGRKLIIGISSKLDMNKYTNIHMGKVHAITYEALMENEENQIMGFQHFGDMKDVTFGHLSLFNPVEFAMVMRVGEQAYPMRHKGVHFINMNNGMKYAYDFFATRFSDKMRGRLLLHGSLEELHQHVDKRCLPKEYGGNMPISDMLDLWLKELAGLKQTLLDLDKMKSHIPIRRRNQQKNAEIEELRGSFKKLEVD